MVDVLGLSAKNYWNSERSRDYDAKRNIRKTQERMTNELLEIQPVSGLVLDAGCGSGFSTSVIAERACAIGIDVSEPMCHLARKKGLDVVCADFQHLPFRNARFDSIVSVSALQWVSASTRDELLIQYANTLFEFSRVLKPKGTVLIQFYPDTSAEFDLFLSLSKRWFTSHIYDNGVGKKAKRYVVLIKKK